MRREFLAAVAGFLLLSPRQARAAESVHIFRELSFDAALKEAAAEKKIVMVDFYTGACVPCKRMDLTTWLDPGVASFLAERAISLRLDAFKEPGLSARYRLREYPTTLLVRPDGTVIDRLLGFLPPDKFLAELKDTLAGRSALQRARASAAAAESSGDDIRRANARKDIAGLLAQEGDPAGALKEYLWLFDDGMKKLPAFAGVRTSYVLMEIKQLGQDYPPALAALRERRDAAKKSLEGPGFTEGDARDFSALNWALWEQKATITFFDSLPAGDPRRRVLGTHVFDALLKARRYVEAADAWPAEKVRAAFEAGAKESWGPKPDPDAEMRRMNREFQMKNAAEGLEALAGSGKLDDARDLIRRMLAVEDSPWVRAILRKHLERAGRAGLLPG